MFNNLLKLKDLTINQINEILNLAQEILDKKTKPTLTNKTICNIFLEPSTRTHYSFLMAENKLGCKILDFSPGSSSMNKGETFYDTVKTFESIGVDAVIVRSAINEWYKELKNIKIPLVNAGDGTFDHPTQTLLDLLTIKQEFNKFKGLTILFVGDIAHSRVAHSSIEVMKRLGMNVLLSAPKEFQDAKYKYTSFDAAIKRADVVNLLRIQNERLTTKMNISIKEYNKLYGLNKSRLNQMKNKAIIIHPAPFNRNVEINDDIVESPKSRIFKQMNNGVFVRMAVLYLLLKD